MGSCKHLGEFATVPQLKSQTATIMFLLKSGLLCNIFFNDGNDAISLMFSITLMQKTIYTKMSDKIYINMYLK